MVSVPQPAGEIYLDYNASTPIAPEVLREMRFYLEGRYGNPSSGHWAAESLKEAIGTARARVAGLLGCDPEEIVFTSGGSESNNHALKGVYFALRNRGNHIVTTAIEHPAVLNPCAFLEKLGAEVAYVKPDRYGRVSPDEIARAIGSRTILVSVMHANNEVGTIQPLADISAIARKRGVLFHTDAAQSVGKIPVKVDELGVDLLTVAGHKLYAPKGIGALYVRRGTPIEPYMHGAGHESGMRAGTENVPYIAALGMAAELAMNADPEATGALKRYFLDRLRELFGDRLAVNGHPEHSLPNTLNVGIQGTDGGALLRSIPEIAASTGSACHTGETAMSPVLKAMNVGEEVGRAAIRFSLGRYSTKAEIDAALALLEERAIRRQAGSIQP